MHVPHYVVFDPLHRLGTQDVTTFSLDGSAYTERPEPRFVAEGLALVQWDGVFERSRERWLRWTDLDGHLFPTLEESEARADAEGARADAERARADAERARADAAVARLRALGIEPEG